MKLIKILACYECPNCRQSTYLKEEPKTNGYPKKIKNIRTYWCHVNSRYIDADIAGATVPDWCPLEDEESEK